MKSFGKRATLLTSASLISVISACAILACKGETIISVFGFDLDKRQLYAGKVESPTETIPFEDPKLRNREVVCLYLRDFDFLKNRCNQ
jgi:hypothetical protein